MSKFGLYDDCQNKWVAFDSAQTFPAYTADVSDAKVFDDRDAAIDFKRPFPIQCKATTGVVELTPLKERPRK